MSKFHSLTQLLCCISLFLTGCFSSPSPYTRVETQTVSKVAQVGEGYLMFSFTFAEYPKLADDIQVVPSFDSYIFKIRRIDDPYILNEVGLRASYSGDYNSDFEVSQGMGFVFAEPLSAGDYEIYGYELWLYARGQSTVISPSNEASIPFTISEDNSTYLGRIEAVHIYDTLTPIGLFNVVLPSRVTFEWSDHQNADILLAYMKFPHIISSQIVEEKADSTINSLNGPTVRLKESKNL